MFGSQDLLVLLGIGVFFFGAKRLPELSRSLGQALSEFKKGVTSGVPEPPPAGDGAPPPAPTPAAVKDESHQGG